MLTVMKSQKLSSCSFRYLFNNVYNNCLNKHKYRTFEIKLKDFFNTRILPIRSERDEILFASRKTIVTLPVRYIIQYVYKC